MGNNINIALIGVSDLEAIGLKTIIKEICGVQIEYFKTFGEVSKLTDKFEVFFVSTEIFMSNLDYFIPKKFKTMIITDRYTQVQENMKNHIISRYEDEALIEEKIKNIICDKGKIEDGRGELSCREKDVLRLIAEGKINKEIADILCISINTVITHRKNISTKLGIKSASGLSLYAMMNGII